MKARARLMVGLAFALALPALLIGALRAATASDDVRIFIRVSAIADLARTVEQRIQATRASLWAFEAERSTDTGRRLRASLDQVGRAVLDLEQLIVQVRENDAFAAELEGWREELNQEPLLADEAPLVRMRAAVGRVRRSVDPLIERRDQPPDPAALRRAHTALETLARDASALAQNARELTRARARRAELTVSLVGRDEIVLFLLLLFSAPLLLGIAPGWMIAPLARLRGVAQRIESGRVRELATTGRDEVAQVTMALRSALGRLEEQDQKQRAKIFEMRRVLRAAISKVSDTVLIVGKAGKIDYANAAASSLLGKELHNLESVPLDEALFSPELPAAIARARSGDVEEAGLDVIIETAHDRVERLHATLTPVRSQEGQVTRVIVVLQR
jgi:PAS domain-containing protein